MVKNKWWPTPAENDLLVALLDKSDINIAKEYFWNQAPIQIQGI
ncbi:MAG: hypothetical protein JG781_1144 [Peptococcaceae bacterium]|nr:hypothetical protein [Peptococcaceae bacterium]